MDEFDGDDMPDSGELLDPLGAVGPAHDEARAHVPTLQPEQVLDVVARLAVQPRP